MPYEIRTRSSGVPSCRGRPRWGQHERSVAEPAASSWEAQRQHDRGSANSKPSSKVAPNWCNTGMIDHELMFLPITYSKHIAKEAVNTVGVFGLKYDCVLIFWVKWLFVHVSTQSPENAMFSNHVGELRPQHFLGWQESLYKTKISVKLEVSESTSQKSVLRHNP